MAYRNAFETRCCPLSDIERGCNRAVKEFTSGSPRRMPAEHCAEYMFCKARTNGLESIMTIGRHVVQTAMLTLIQDVPHLRREASQCEWLLKKGEVRLHHAMPNNRVIGVT